MLPALLIAVPFVAAILCGTAGRRADLARPLALAGAGITVLLAVLVVVRTTGGGEPLTWAFEGTSRPLIQADGLAAVFVLLTAILTTLGIPLSRLDGTQAPAFFSLLLALEAAVMAVFLAGDLVVFYVAWEAVLVPMFFLIGRFGHEDRRHAAMKFFLYTFAGSAPMLVGILIIIAETGSTALGSSMHAVPASLQSAVFWLLAAGMLVKLPAWPLHSWLPDAHVEAPTAGSMLLAGVLLKMGGYGLLRVAIPAAPDGFLAAAPALAGLGLVGIVYGALTALSQQDLKRLVAYSSVAHMGFVLVGLAAAGTHGMTGAVLSMVSHGLVAALLFGLVGTLHERTHTRNLSELGGLFRPLPRWTAALIFGTLASLGLPALSGFPGELLVVLDGMRVFGWWMLPVFAGMLLAAAYGLRAVASTSFGPLDDRWTAIPDLTRTELAALAPLVVGIVLLGLVPGQLMQLVAPALEPLVRLVGGGS